MDGPTSAFLLLGGALSATAAVLHLGCIAFGARWYRALGAGEQMARMDMRGHWYPTVASLVISGMLLTWSLYAFSGAGLIPKLPLTRWALSAITAIYLVRGLAFMPLKAYFPGNSTTFWIVSSANCFALGVIHLLGLRQVWSRL